jgi:hypothetical protein
MKELRLGLTGSARSSSSSTTSVLVKVEARRTGAWVCRLALGALFWSARTDLHALRNIASDQASVACTI